MRRPRASSPFRSAVFSRRAASLRRNKNEITSADDIYARGATGPVLGSSAAPPRTAAAARLINCDQPKSSRLFIKLAEIASLARRPHRYPPTLHRGSPRTERYLSPLLHRRGYIAAGKYIARFRRSRSVIALRGYLYCNSHFLDNSRENDF